MRTPNRLDIMLTHLAIADLMVSLFLIEILFKVLVKRNLGIRAMLLLRKVLESETIRAKMTMASALQTNLF